MSKKPVALIIMDGFGYNKDTFGNAIAAANKPNIDKYLQGPHTLIGASGLDVGLPDGQRLCAMRWKIARRTAQLCT